MGMTSDITIPSWAVAIIPVLITWMALLTVWTFRNREAIAVNSATDQKVSDELDKIYKAVDDNKNSLNHSIEKLETKLDSFLAQEMSFLKSIIIKN